jgi:hypothetical protein
MSKKFKKLTHLGFVTALLLLLCNDFYWKTAFHNAFTGKLSDFAGLFAFPYFLSVVWGKPKKVVYVLTALGFIFWKSSFSGGFIEIWNAYFIEIQRVVDYSDLIALMILPVSYQYLLQNQTYQIRLHPTLFIVLSCFAFGATSIVHRVKIPNQNIDKTYSFDCSKEELRNRILKMYAYNKPVIGLMFKKYRITNVDINKKYFDRVASENYPVYATIEAEIRNPTQDTIRIRMSRNTYTSIKSTFILSGDNMKSSLHLTVIDLELFPKDVYDKEGVKREESYLAKKYLEAVEKKFLNQLRKK